jgi:hypothetical protein
MTAPMNFGWLSDLAYNEYSQYGEDGVLQAIFSVIRPMNEWCFECGAADGLFFSNTRRLIEQGWHAALIEADPIAFARLQENCRQFGDRVKCVNEKVDAGHRLEGILDRCGAPTDLDLAVIDVDGQDYYLFNSLMRYRPRVVQIEFAPNAEEDFLPPLGGEGQAGLLTMRRLAAGKFYTLVYRSWCNLIFVQQPLDRLLDGQRPLT